MRALPVHRRAVAVHGNGKFTVSSNVTSGAYPIAQQVLRTSGSTASVHLTIVHLVRLWLFRFTERKADSFAPPAFALSNALALALDVRSRLFQVFFAKNLMC